MSIAMSWLVGRSRIESLSSKPGVAMEGPDRDWALVGQAIKIAEPGGCLRPFVELGTPMANLLLRFQKQKYLLCFMLLTNYERNRNI